jgi:glycosyltransferase involved in cell wall biosynthesis
MRQALEHRARELRVEHAVRFVGAIQNGQLRDLFKSTDVVCVPSRNEPFGIVVLESWAAGKPCIVSCNGGARELVEHGQDGLVVNPDPNAIAWGVCEFFRNFEHARWAGSRGRVKAAYGYAWNSVAERTERAYHAIC